MERNEEAAVFTNRMREDRIREGSRTRTFTATSICMVCSKKMTDNPNDSSVLHMECFEVMYFVQALREIDVREICEHAIFASPAWMMLHFANHAAKVGELLDERSGVSFIEEHKRHLEKIGADQMVSEIEDMFREMEDGDAAAS